jgi:hypothetical protein
MKARTRTELNLNSFRVAKVLENKEETSFGSLLEKFQALGGRIEPAVILEFSQETKEFKLSGEINLPSDANIYPVCEAGENRSQIMTLILQKEHRELKVAQPHGAKGSVDPFILPTMSADELQHSEVADWEREMAYQFYPTLTEPLYEKELETKRVSRMGEAELKIHINAIQKRSIKELKIARNHMDKNYFGKMINDGCHVISFNQSVHIMMARLVEVAKKQNKILNRVVLHPVESDDPAVLKAYRSFYNTLNKAIKITPALCQEVKPNLLSTILPEDEAKHSSIMLHKSEYQTYSLEYRQYLSSVTQETRHAFGHISTEEYWRQLSREQKSKLNQDFMKIEQTIPKENQSNCLIS